MYMYNADLGRDRGPGRGGGDGEGGWPAGSRGWPADRHTGSPADTYAHPPAYAQITTKKSFTPFPEICKKWQFAAAAYIWSFTLSVYFL